MWFDVPVNVLWFLGLLLACWVSFKVGQWSAEAGRALHDGTRAWEKKSEYRE